MTDGHKGASSNRLREFRLQRGLKQAGLAARLGVDHTTVSAWERGRQSPGPATLLALADVLEVPVADLGFTRDAISTTPVDDDVNRQEFLAGLLGTAVVTSAGQGRRYVRHIGQVEVASFRRLLATLYELDDHHGGDGHVYALALRSMRRLERVIEDHDYTASTGAALLELLGEVTEHAGWLAYDERHEALFDRVEVKGLHPRFIAVDCEQLEAA